MNPETEQLEEVQDRPVFTATTHLNAAMQQEAATALTPKATTVVSWICFGVIALMAGVLVWQLIATGNKNNLFMLVVLALTMVFLLYNKFTAPKKALQRWEAGIRRQYGTDCLTLETEFYPHNLAQTLKENDDHRRGLFRPLAHRRDGASAPPAPLARQLVLCRKERHRRRNGRRPREISGGARSEPQLRRQSNGIFPRKTDAG